MTDEPGKKPDFLAYAVKNFETRDGNQDATWRQVGVAWLHKDSEGLDVVLDALPTSGRVVLRKPKEK